MNKDTYTAQNTTWAKPSDEQLEACFHDPENFQPGIRVAAIIYAIGRFDSEVDWDRGQWLYEWRRKQLRILVVTQSAYVSEITLLDPTLPRTNFVQLEILWRNTALGR